MSLRASFILDLTNCLPDWLSKCIEHSKRETKSISPTNFGRLKLLCQGELTDATRTLKYIQGSINGCFCSVMLLLSTLLQNLLFATPTKVRATVLTYASLVPLNPVSPVKHSHTALCRIKTCFFFTHCFKSLARGFLLVDRQTTKITERRNTKIALLTSK